MFGDLRMLLVSLMTVATFVLGGNGLQAAEPSQIDSILRQAVDRGDVPCVVAMAATSEKVIYQGAFGKRSVAANEDATLDTVFRIASMTKVVTSVAALQLVEQGLLTLDTPVSQHIPSFAQLQVLEGIDEATQTPQLRPAARPVTVRHLLTHTAGFGYEFWNPLLRDAVKIKFVPGMTDGGDGFLQAPLLFDPGEQWQYGINTNWLGRVVEAARVSTLDEIFKEQVFEPLRMEDTHFSLPEDKVSRLVTLHRRQDDGTLEESARNAPEPVTDYNGGGGLFSTAPDYVRFLQALLRGGELDDVRILEADTVRRMGQNQIGALEVVPLRSVMPEFSNDVCFFPGSTNRFGFGFLINSDPVVGGRASGSLAWAGIFNTYFWLDPAQDTCGVVMTQVLPFFDAKVIGLFEDFERAVYRHVER